MLLDLAKLPADESDIVLISRLFVLTDMVMLSAWTEIAPVRVLKRKKMNIKKHEIQVWRIIEYCLVIIGPFSIRYSLKYNKIIVFPLLLVKVDMIFVLE